MYYKSFSTEYVHLTKFLSIWFGKPFVWKNLKGQFYKSSSSIKFVDLSILQIPSELHTKKQLTN
jgi:hypothetical protein